MISQVVVTLSQKWQLLSTLFHKNGNFCQHTTIFLIIYINRVMALDGPISKIFELLAKMVEVIDDYSEKVALQSLLPATRLSFLKLYNACAQSNDSNDGIHAFLQIKNYIASVKTRYDHNLQLMLEIVEPTNGRLKKGKHSSKYNRNRKPNETVRRETRRAYKVADFLDNVCSDICAMLRNKPSTEHPQPYGTKCTMILHQLETYTPITYEHVEEMQKRQETTVQPSLAHNIMPYALTWPILKPWVLQCNMLSVVFVSSLRNSD